MEATPAIPGTWLIVNWIHSFCVVLKRERSDKQWRVWRAFFKMACLSVCVTAVRVPACITACFTERSGEDGAFQPLGTTFSLTAEYAYDRKLPHSPPPAWGLFLKEKGRCTIPCWILFPKPLAPGATVVRGDVFQRRFTFLAFMIWAWFCNRSFRNLTLAYLSGQISQHFAACSTSRFSVSFAWNIPLPETKKKKNIFPVSKTPNHTCCSILSTKAHFSVREFARTLILFVLQVRFLTHSFIGQIVPERWDAS